MRGWRHQFPFPKFEKLAQLDLYTHVDGDVLLGLLHAAPYLKFMEISLHSEESWEHDDFDEGETMPSCVVSHLEEVLFHYRKVEDPDHLVAKFLLLTGSKLKKFHVFNFFKRNLSSDEILGKLCAFPKASTSLTFSTPRSGEIADIRRKWKTRS